MLTTKKKKKKDNYIQPSAPVADLKVRPWAKILIDSKYFAIEAALLDLVLTLQAYGLSDNNIARELDNVKHHIDSLRST